MNKCGNCGMYFPQSGSCGLTRLKVDPQEDFCSKYQKQLPKCNICGNMFLGNPIIEKIDDNWITYCGDCFSAIGTCGTCKLSKSCEFETNPSQIPKVVMKQMQRGNTVIQTQVKNPSRIEITCAKGCKCFSEKEGCLRQMNNKCGNFVLNFHL